MPDEDRIGEDSPLVTDGMVRLRTPNRLSFQLTASILADEASITESPRDDGSLFTFLRSLPTTLNFE